MTSKDSGYIKRLRKAVARRTKVHPSHSSAYLLEKSLNMLGIEKGTENMRTLKTGCWVEPSAMLLQT